MNSAPHSFAMSVPWEAPEGWIVAVWFEPEDETLQVYLSDLKFPILGVAHFTFVNDSGMCLQEFAIAALDEMKTRIEMRNCGVPMFDLLLPRTSPPVLRRPAPGRPRTPLG